MWVAAHAASQARQVADQPELVRALWALAVAVLGLVLREAWQIRQARRQRRGRDRAILTELLRETHAVLGAAKGVARELENERTSLDSGRGWRLKPHLLLPTSAYELVKTDPPRALLEQTRAISTLLVLQTQCAYTNALTEAQYRWKVPDAAGVANQAKVIRDFQGAISESLERVVDRAQTVLSAVEQAGEALGGRLDLSGSAPRRGWRSRLLRQQMDIIP